MKAFREYWTFSAIRGAMTVLAAIAIVSIPQATSYMLSLPVLVALAIDCFATYAILDAGVMVLLAHLLPERAKSSRILYVQAAMAILSAGLLYLIAYQQISLRYVMLVASGQAAFAAFAEWCIARNTHAQYGCFSCYTTTIALAVSAVFLPFAGTLNPADMSLALAAYVGLYGACEFLLGGRMLFVEYRSKHPAHVASQTWRTEMYKPLLELTLTPLEVQRYIDCSECPAEALCRDYSLKGQVHKILSEREPPIVRMVKLATLFESQAVPATGRR